MSLFSPQRRQSARSSPADRRTVRQQILSAVRRIGAFVVCAVWLTACGSPGSESSVGPDAVGRVLSGSVSEDPEPPTLPTRPPTDASKPTDLGSALYDPAEHKDAAPPIWLTVPSLGIDKAPVVSVGVEDDGEMEIPDGDEVGWYRFGSAPGQSGSAVLAAHIAYEGVDGVFRELAQLPAGETFTIGSADFTERSYQVESVEQFSKASLPRGRIFASDGAPVVALVTCGGEFNPSLRSYDDNVVAFARPI